MPIVFKNKKLKHYDLHKNKHNFLSLSFSQTGSVKIFLTLGAKIWPIKFALDREKRKKRE